MFAARYFPDRYFAPRYWAKVGAVVSAVTPVVSRSVGLDTNPSDTLSLDTNPSDVLAVNA